MTDIHYFRNTLPGLVAIAFPILVPFNAFAQPANTYTEPEPQLRGLPATDLPPNNMDQVKNETLSTPGAIFIQPDQVLVKPALLKALIQLDNKMSPYRIDADSEQVISLRDSLKIALENNLPVKISYDESQSKKWQYYAQLGGFLPSVVNGFGYQGITGNYASPFGVLVPIDNSYLTVPNNLNYYFFQGGKVLFGSLQARHNYKASMQALKGATNDVLLDVTKLYYDLALNDVLIQIKVKAVETSSELVTRNEDRYENGANTKLDVLQAKTLSSRDRQDLISQQIARRHAAINLATALNLDPATDLTVGNRMVSKIRLVDPSMKISDLIRIAIDNRPELKKYEQLRLAAKAAIKVARAPLFPTVLGTATAGTTGARVVANNSTAQASAAALGFAPGSFSTSSLTAIGNSGGSPKFSLAEIYQLGIGVQWTLGGLGTIDLSNVQSAKWQARKAELEFKEELAKIYQEVRNAYLDSIDADNLISETTAAVDSSNEQLAVATERLQEGVGIDLDAVNAQRDNTRALVDKANAIIKFNTAQANILRAIGRISVDTLTSPAPLRE